MEPPNPLNPIKKMLVQQVKTATTPARYKIFDILAGKAKSAADNHHDTAFNADSSDYETFAESEEKVDGGGRRTRRKKRKKRKKRKSRRNKKRKKSKKIKSRRRKSSGRK